MYWKNSPNVSDHAPERYHYEDNDRITPIIVVMDLGWSMTDQTTYDLNPTLFNGGSHGYDNDLPDMLSIFLGSGPAFQINVTVDRTFFFPNQVNIFKKSHMCQPLTTSSYTI